jgi:ABC-type multidrug transport system ATPase subunit/pSer/pThr/pTyr-binding forkhead associated (FHA) protein
MSLNQCPSCGAQNSEQASFCGRCGQVLEPQPSKSLGGELECPHCHEPVRPGARFCPSCGYDLAQPSSPNQTDLPGILAAGVPAPAPKDPTQTVHLEDAKGQDSLVVRWMGGDTQRRPLDKAEISIGRAPGSDVLIRHPAVSGHHLRLAISPQGMTVTDLNSTNGTQLNGQRIQPGAPHPVRFGDILRIGDLTGNWVSLVLQSAAGEAARSLSLGQLDLSGQTNFLIGRDPKAYLHLNHPTVSYHHAQIIQQDRGLVIKDLSSTNGTFVNGQRITQAMLTSGDQIQIGPFRLAYDARQQSLAPSMRLGHRIDAIRLGREVAGSRRKPPALILKDVSLTVNPGEFIALVGGSGAGKSTLLKAMNGYEPANHGQLLLDGEPLYPRLDVYRTQMGYVPQDDIIHPDLPVKLALSYAARLRLPDARPEEIQARIQDALRAVDLTEHADKPVKILSGGQRKRVSIAVELLARPTLFFLDEPTSGLDPGLEKKMMYDLNRLSDEGRTIVLVTHATANIEQCDQVAFLSQGRLAYYGPPNEALQFFGVRDFSDIYLKLAQEIDPAKGLLPPPELQAYYPPKISASGKTLAGPLWAEHFQVSEQFERFVAERQKSLSGNGGASIAAAAPRPLRRSRDSRLRQSWILARRHLDLIRLDWRTLFILMLMLPLIGLLFMSVSGKTDFTGRPGSAEQIRLSLESQVLQKIRQWEQKTPAIRGKLDDETEISYVPVENAQTLVTMLALALTQGGTFAAAYEIVKERGVFRRERAVNLSVTAYVFSKVLVLGAFALFQVASVLFIVGLVVDMDFPGALFKNSGALELFISLYIAVLASITFGLFISAIVPNQDVVLYAILIQLFIQIILGGALFEINSKAASSITLSYWTTDALGSSVDIDQLNREGWACVGVEVFEEKAGGVIRRPVCSKVNVALPIDYQHTPAHILTLWSVLIFQGVFWFILTVLVQMRRR